MNIRSDYMRAARTMKTLVDAKIEAFDSDKKDMEFETFSWAFSVRDDFLSKRAREWIQQHMSDWETALQTFETMKAKAILQALASAIAMDIPDFLQEMHKQAQKYGDDLIRFQPQFEPFIQNGVSTHTAAELTTELETFMSLKTAEIGKLGSERAQAAIAILNVQRLASLRAFFDAEAKSVQTCETP